MAEAKDDLHLTSLPRRSSQMHKGATANLVFLQSFRSKFGGGKSTGFCTIYDSEEAAKKYEPQYKSIRVLRPPSHADPLRTAHPCLRLLKTERTYGEDRDLP